MQSKLDNSQNILYNNDAPREKPLIIIEDGFTFTVKFVNKKTILKKNFCVYPFGDCLLPYYIDFSEKTVWFESEKENYISQLIADGKIK